MGIPTFRVILDTNILVRGLVNSRSYSGQILSACEKRRVIPLLSMPLLSEYRFILAEPTLVARYHQLSEERVRPAIERLMYVGDLLRDIKGSFEFFRDRKDEKLIVLTIAGRATHLITTDKDLLDLAGGRGDAARRFLQRAPSTSISKPEEFVRRYAPEIDL